MKKCCGYCTHYDVIVGGLSVKLICAMKHNLILHRTEVQAASCLDFTRNMSCDTCGFFDTFQPPYKDGTCRATPSLMSRYANEWCFKYEPDLVPEPETKNTKE